MSSAGGKAAQPDTRHRLAYIKDSSIIALAQWPSRCDRSQDRASPATTGSKVIEIGKIAEERRRLDDGVTAYHS